MKILVDENIPTICVKHLSGMGHEILDVRGTREEGMLDEDLWSKAQQDGRLLITMDIGFARRRHTMHSGIPIVLLRQPNRERITRRVIEAMQLLPSKEWAGLLVVMRDTVMSTWRAPVE